MLHRVYKPIGSQEADILLELHRADPYLLVPFARIKVMGGAAARGWEVVRGSDGVSLLAGVLFQD